MSRRSTVFEGTMILALAAVLLGGMLTARWYFNEGPRDPVTHCLPGPPPGQTIAFIDKTDLWNDAQADRLVDHVFRLVMDRMKDEQLFTMFVFGEKLTPGFKEVFRRCKPPPRARNGVIDSESYRRRTFEDVFGKPLREVMADAKTPAEADCSPIAEVLVDVLGREEVKTRPGATRIVLFSDMAQNSAIYSAFQRTKCFAVKPGRDHALDGRPLVKYFDDRKGSLKVEGASAVIYQVIPAKNPERVKDLARQKWGDVFRALGMEADWQLL